MNKQLFISGYLVDGNNMALGAPPSNKELIRLFYHGSGIPPESLSITISDKDNTVTLFIPNNDNQEIKISVAPK